MITRKMTSLPGVTVFTVPDGNFDNNVVLPKNLIVIHTEDGFKAGTESRFTDPQAHVSAQYGVNQDGTYDEYVDEDQVAYHAGDYAVNQRSIGIEHEDFGQPNAVRPDALYTASAKLVNDICNFWGIPIDRQHIVKHSEVDDSPTACPDSLDIDRIIREAQALNQPTPTETTYTQSDVDKLNATIDSLNGIIKDKNNQITELNTKVTSLDSQITDLQTSLDSKTPIAEQLPQCQAQLEQANTDITGLHIQINALNKTISGLSGTSYKKVNTRVLINELIRRSLQRVGLA